MRPYRTWRAPRRETLRLRGLDMHVRRWGPEPAAPQAPVFLLHGWQDTGDTFQFMVDAFERDWPLLALDWRGFGRSEWPQEGYWFADYFADLEALLDRLSPESPAHLVGHSMGGNIATMYAGLRPGRVRSVVSLEGFGLPRSEPEQAPEQMCRWLDQVKLPTSFKEYASVEELASVIGFRYPRFSEAQAAFVAEAWSQPADGRVRLVGDPRHRWVNPLRYHREDAEACWRKVRAPSLMILGDESEYLSKLGDESSDAAFRSRLPHIDIVRLAGAGHMLHIEKAEAVAHLVEAFLSAHQT